MIDRAYPDPADVTRMLQQLEDGDDAAMEELMPAVYGELRRLARRQLSGGPGRTLDTTGLVHEAFLKLAGSESRAWADRCHFFAVAATAMRQILVDHARQRGASKRGGDWKQVDLDHVQLDVEDQTQLVVDIDDALQKLSRIDARLTRVVECRFFADMNLEETSVALGVNEKTVRRDWIKARAWLHRELTRDDW